GCGRRGAGRDDLLGTGARGLHTVLSRKVGVGRDGRRNYRQDRGGEALTMLIGRVIGEVVATSKHPSHEGLKLLAVATIGLDGEVKAGPPLISVDSVGAGVGDRVLGTLDGWGAMTSVERFPAPIDSAVLGIIDEVDIAADAIPAQ